jgi:hypothetical protein
VLTLVVVLVFVAIAAALILAFTGFGPRVIRRTTVVDRPAQTLDAPVRRRRVVEEETVDRTL